MPSLAPDAMIPLTMSTIWCNESKLQLSKNFISESAFASSLALAYLQFASFSFNHLLVLN